MSACHTPFLVLMVDDQASQRAINRAALESLGLAVIGCAGAGQAVAAFLLDADEQRERVRGG